MGLDASQWHLEKSAAFCDKATDAAITSLCREDTVNQELQAVYESLKGSKLSLDLNQAVRFVLADLLDNADDSFVYVTDALDMHSAQPYKQYQDKRTGLTTYGPRFNFRKHKERELDPFQRFSGKEMDAADWFYHCWCDQKASLDGSVFEAVVAQYMENHMACASCKFRNSLRWNGGFGALSSWADVVCIKCHATYEIKSVADLDKMDMRLNKNDSIRCGSFKTFYKYHPLQQRYLLLVSRGATLERGQNELTHQVAIGEISRVLPNLTDESFIAGQSTIRLVALVELKKETVKKIWCSVPLYDGDFFAIAQEVYIAKFGHGKWHRNNKNQNTITLCRSPSMVSNNISKATEKEWAKRQQKEEEEKKMLESLGALCLGGDTSEDAWEELYFGA